MRFRKIAVAVSGGVDSAVATFLLKKKRYDVQGVFMVNWDIIDEKGFCSVDRDYQDASYLCNVLDIKLHCVNFVKEYWNEVFCNFLKEYELGYTPNPDILCNKYIKFNHLFNYAMNTLGVDAIAMGHYANTTFGPYLENYNINKDVKLLRARDSLKDQTFFLSQVEQESLRKTMFPLGNLTKSEVKTIAKNNDLCKFAVKKESMGICFIGSRNFQTFIKQYTFDKPGNFINIDTGKIVGKHDGIHQWTIGQRSRIAGIPNALYVARKNAETNTIYVVEGNTHPVLCTDLIFTSQAHWIHEKPEEISQKNILRCQFKFQHTEKWIDCEVYEVKQGLIISIKSFKRAITPGQFAVFWKDKECLGSARIIHYGISQFSLNYKKNIHSSSE